MLNFLHISLEQSLTNHAQTVKKKLLLKERDLLIAVVDSSFAFTLNVRKNTSYPFLNINVSG